MRYALTALILAAAVLLIAPAPAQAMYRDGPNLYQYCRSAPTQYVDPSGLWPSGRVGTRKVHQTMTTAAVNPVLNGLNNPIPNKKCSKWIEKTLNDANAGQDAGTPTWLGGKPEDPINQDQRHYNREPGQSPEDAEEKYQKQLKDEQGTFTNELAKKPAGCEAALKALGRLAHSWQDFYAHAIRKDGADGKESSPTPGWDAWSADPPVTGSPDNTGNFNPSSYGALKSEHPLNREPVDNEKGAEYKDRYKAAQDYTQAKLQEMLPQWWTKCGCWCNDRK